MTTSDWRGRAGTLFETEKQPAQGAAGMVVTNHPRASAAAIDVLAGGGNAVDAAVTALFALTVVEPMMVGICGGGMAHIRLADGRHLVIDGLSTAPGACGPDAFRPVSDEPPDYLDTEGRENAVGPKAVAVPGTLLGWCQALSRYGTISLAEALAPAIRLAADGFTVTPYLRECIAEAAPDMAHDPAIAALFLPDGAPIAAGSRLVQGDYAETLRTIAADGPDCFYRGDLAGTIADHFASVGGFLSADDLSTYATIERDVVRGDYRGVEIVGPPPPSSGGVHVIQMLNILERYDIAGMGFGSADHVHLIAEVLKIAFADRDAATADPAFVDVPVERLIDKAYAAERAASIDMSRAQAWAASVASAESPNTTHITVADGAGNIVASTQTINNLFGARFIIPGTGIIPNNYMRLFDPHPGHALSIAPGKRITTSQAPLIGIRDGRPLFALGLPGGLRIFGSAMQAVVNLVDHGMNLQEAVEAPRLWTQGQAVEIEDAVPATMRAALADRGHDILTLPHIGGGMNAIGFGDDGMMTGAACWRADGTPIGLGGGLARAGVRFWPDQVRR